MAWNRVDGLDYDTPFQYAGDVFRVSQTTPRKADGKIPCTNFGFLTEDNTFIPRSDPYDQDFQPDCVIDTVKLTTVSL